MALLLTCLATSQAKRKSANSSSVGCRFVTTLAWPKSSPPGRGSAPGVRRRFGENRARDAGGTRPSGPVRRDDVLFPAGPGRQDCRPRRHVAGRDDALDEAVRFGDLPGRRFIDLAVEAEHAAVGAERIAFVGLDGTRRQGVADAAARRDCCA